MPKIPVITPLAPHSSGSMADSQSNRNREAVYLTVSQVAEHLQLSARQVRRFIESGELIATRLGRSVRIHRNDLNAFCALRRDVR